MDEPISKSQKKKDATALQKIGIKLVLLPPSKLDKLPLTDGLRQAIDDAKIIKTHEAKRRQAQLIGKLIRAADHEEIIKAYELILADENSQTAFFKEWEQWRDKLVSGGNEELTDFLNKHEGVDVQQLRKLIKKGREEKISGKPAGALKALFRFLRESAAK